MWHPGGNTHPPTLLTPPPTYQGLKPELGLIETIVESAFNTPSNIPRIET